MLGRRSWERSQVNAPATIPAGENMPMLPLSCLRQVRKRLHPLVRALVAEHFAFVRVSTDVGSISIHVIRAYAGFRPRPELVAAWLNCSFVYVTPLFRGAFELMEWPNNLCRQRGESLRFLPEWL